MNTFLAANSCEGFYSLFDQITSLKDHNLLLIKGGPGTGKSSLMKRLADAAEKKGYTVERMHCSSDPESLDGVRIAERKLVLLDTTPPHSAEPRYPGAVEQLIPLGEYWDRAKLIPKRRRIIELTEEIGALFSRIYRLLRAAGELERYSDSLLSPAFQERKAEQMLKKFLSKAAAVPIDKTAKCERRFISALSGKGQVMYEDCFENCRQILLIEDSYENGHLLTALADKMLAALGYDRQQMCCPTDPQKIDHLVVPELSLGIVRQNGRLQLQSELPVTKSIHMRQLTAPEVVSQHKHKLQFVKKLVGSLNEEVSELLASEKALHDELEKIYIEAMDFEALNRKTEALIEELL